MSTMRRALITSVVLALGLPTTSTAVAGTAEACAGFEPVALGGTIAEPRVAELSGLAGSRRHPDVLWGHNDSGGAPELYAFTEDGTSLGAYPLEGAEAIDWEDMAAGPDGLYVGDIGDNESARPTVTVYRVPEPATAPAAPGATLSGVEAFTLTYPDGSEDAEALLVDPRSGDLVIVTKSLFGSSRVLATPAASLVSGAPIAMTDAGALEVPEPPTATAGLPGSMVTSGEVSPDGSLVVLRTYRSVLVFERAEGESIADALRGDPCFGPQEEEPQGEALAFTHDGSAYVTASEGTNVPINRVELADRAATTTTGDSGRPADGAVDDAGDDTTLVAVLVGAGCLLLVLGGAARWVARRRRRSGAG